MHQEAIAQGIEFETFWLGQVTAGVAYFFQWLGPPRATVLLIWHDSEILHIECRGAGDRLLSALEAAPIVAAVRAAFLDRRAERPDA